MGLKEIIPFVLGFLNEAPTLRNKLLIPRPGETVMYFKNKGNQFFITTCVCDEFCVIIK